MTTKPEFLFFKESWSGDSKDGVISNGEGFHYFRMRDDGYIEEAYEVYETEDGTEIATHLAELEKISWIKDFGFEDFETLDKISKLEFERIKKIAEEN